MLDQLVDVHRGVFHDQSTPIAAVRHAGRSHVIALVSDTTIPFSRTWSAPQQRAGRCGEARPAGKASAGAALVAELLALAEQCTRVVKRFPHLVQLDVTQQADARVALDDLDVFMKWARQVTAIRAVGVPAQRRARRESVTT
ncbi:hypothetical protein [Nonomuraea sp. GTA35]|uniref:hypothetical protein n=1 Tax=Nonomuraea sp. GTA35 TaxID=1676746 RepID=UPI0035C06ACE